MAEPLFVLASASPRRRFLLEALGLPFVVADNPWEETNPPGERAQVQVRRLAAEKFGHWFQNHPSSHLPVLTADTLLEFRGRAINKPADVDQAIATYRTLAGRRHRVLTSVVFGRPGRARQITVSTSVEFVPWEPGLYRRYLEKGEWRDAAGGYRIQEGGGVLIRRLTGSWTNVMGLPSAEVYAMIRQNLRVPRA